MNARGVSTIGLAQTSNGTGICQFYNLVKRGVSRAKIETLCMLLLYGFRCRERKLLLCVVLVIFRILFNVYEAICMIVMRQRSTSSRVVNEANFETFR